MRRERNALRVLVLAPFAPRLDAPHGGGRSIAELVMELGARHRVGLLCLRSGTDPSTDDFVRGRCEFVEEFELSGVGGSSLQRWRRRVRLLRALALGRPMWAADTMAGPFASRVEQLTRSWRPDVVQAEFHVMGQYLGLVAPSEAARVLTEHEPGASAALDIVRGSRGLKRILFWADSIAWRRFEAGILRDADAVVAYTDRDRRALSELAPEARIVRIPLGTRVPPTPADPAAVEPESLVFVGNFMHPPNVDAARRLIDGILPRIVERASGARLYLVGDQTPDAFRRAAGAHVEVTGFVEDVGRYLSLASVVVAPIRMGGGLRVKVLEALAAGKPIVASGLAVEGLAVVDGDEFVLADSDEEFAYAVLALFHDEKRRRALASAARRWAEENLGWERTIAGYERLYGELRRDPNTRPCR